MRFCCFIRTQLLIILVEDFIGKYFHAVFRHREIIDFLKNRHGIKVSLCTVHRFLKRANFYRKGKQSTLLDIMAFIKYNGEGTMHKRCIRNGLMVSRIIIAQIMNNLDPIGVNTRKRLKNIKALIILQSGAKFGLAFRWIQ